MRVMPRIGKVGDLPNDKVSTCKICKSRGFPHEPITFSVVYGRVLSDGSRQILGYKPMDYYTDRPHQHKEPKRQQQTEREYMGWNLQAFE